MTTSNLQARISDDPATVTQTTSRWTLVVLLFSFSFLSTHLFLSPLVPVLLSGDQVFFWTYGLRVAHGQMPYRDFFQFTAPGADWIFATLFRLFGASVWVTDVAVLLLGVALAMVLFEVGRRFASDAIAAWTAILYLLMIYARLLSATHHVISILVIGCAFLALFRPRPVYFAAGTLFGVASLITQTHGIFAGVAVSMVLAFDSDVPGDVKIRDIGLLWLGILSLLVPVELYLAFKVGFAQLWYFQVTLPARWPGSGASSPWWFAAGEASSKQYVELILLYAFAPVIYTLCLLRLFRSQFADNREVRMLLAVGIALMVEILPAANRLRILSVDLPAFPILAWMFGQRRLPRVLVPIAWSLVLFLAARSAWIAQTGKLLVIPTIAGSVATSRPEAQKLVWLQSHLGPQDVFFEAAYPGAYLPLGKLDPLYADNLTPTRITPGELSDRTVSELSTQSVRYILWNTALDAPVQPETRVPFQAFRDYVEQNYRIVFVLDNGESILEKRTTASAKR